MKHINLLDATFLLTIGRFLLAVELLCLQLCFATTHGVTPGLWDMYLAIGGISTGTLTAKCCN